MGYKIDEEKNFIVDEKTAPIVQKIYEMFVGGNNYMDIARYLNERGIKTSMGGAWGKTSLFTIVRNRKYIGKYIYKGKEVDGGIPRIISDELFAEAQVILARLAQAPSRGKAKVDYLLSQKLLCGSCGNNFTGMSAASRDKKVHYYYACAENRVTKKCKKKAIRKQLVEDSLITAIAGNKTAQNMYGVLTDEFIDLIAAETYLMIQAERNDSEIIRLENLMTDNQKAINNLMQALMLGKIADTLLMQIEKLENENKELKSLIAYEKSLQVDYNYNDIRQWLLHFRDLDYSSIKNRRHLIDTLVYKVILYEDKMKIIFHLKGGQHKGELLLHTIFPDYDGETPINEKDSNNSLSNPASGSPANCMVGAIGLEPMTLCL